MSDKLIESLQKLNITKKSKILLAVSGGIDSMVLLDMLYNYGYSIAIAHCNFCLRGSESDKDQLFVQKIADQYNVNLYSQQFNTKTYSVENKISIQMAARKLRYDWFNVLKENYNFDFICTAHHHHDSVETFLINLIRGTGISGLHGIQAVSHNIIRPLSAYSKQDIIAYAKNNNIMYREDSSNTDDKYVRNKIRNKIIPLMQDINPRVLESIGLTISRINDVEGIYRKFVSDKKRKLLIKKNDEFKIDIESILNEISPKQLLYEIVSDFGFNDIDSIFNSLSSSSGKEFFSSNYYMIKDRNQLIISRHILMNSVIVNKGQSHINNPLYINFRVSSSDLVSVESKLENQMYIDYSKLEFPLLIRPWKHGDTFIPLGMNCFKKVSDFFIDNKFSLIQKKKTLLLISNNNIVCILGKRLDDRFKLVEDSKKVYIVSL